MPMPSEGKTGDDESLYDILGVATDVSPAAIRKAYRKLAVKYHPDKVRTDDPDERARAEAFFKHVAYAYSVLSDPEQRKVYDHLGEDGLKGSEGGGFQDKKVDAEALFAQFFKNFGASGAFGSSFAGKNPFGDFVGSSGSSLDVNDSPSLGAHTSDASQYRVTCTLEELYCGCRKTLRVTRKGKRQESHRDLSFVVTPGWKEGTKITFAGEGDEIEGGARKNVIFVIRQKPHESYKRQGSDLVYNAHISVLQALVGGFTVKVPMLDGGITHVNVAEGEVISPTSTRIIHGKGMPSSKRKGCFGDLIVTFSVEFPERLDDVQRQGLRDILMR